MSVAKMVSIARSQIGQGEHPAGSNKNKFTDWYGFSGSWCDMFISWVANQAGELKAIGGKHAYCPDHVSWFRSHGEWGHTARVGAIVFFDWNGNGLADHVGLVVEAHSGYVITVEGNSADKVRLVRRSSYILGYGYPKYAGGYGAVTLTRVLKLRKPYMTGSDVKAAQGYLNRKGNYKLTPDGSFGSKTRAAVVSFQKKNGLTADGEIGPKTWVKLSK